MKAVIYARYSSDNQREESIEGQLRECKEYAERNDMVIVKTYIDRALSAKTDNRPEFQRMIKDSSQEFFDVVLVWKLDRFARNRYDSAHYKAVLRKNRVKVISAKETISDGPEGIILESMLEGYAEYYSAELAQKVTRGMIENTLKGKYNGGIVTFGYIVDENKNFQPHPVNAAIVQDIFRRYSEGENTKDILESLRAQGVKNQQGHTPAYNFVTNILKNRRYLGEYRFQDTVAENVFPVLVSPEVFERCQKRLAINQKKPAHFKKVKDKYLLTGKIFCGYCGGHMSGVSGTSSVGVTHRYYHCNTAKTKKLCDKKRIRKDLIESIVIDYTFNILNDKSIVRDIVDVCYLAQTKENSALLAMNNRLQQTEKEIENIINAIKQGIITTSITKTLKALEIEKEQLQISISQEQIERPIMTKEEIRYWIDRFRLMDRENERDMQTMIDTFVNSIYVYDDKMLITFNYRDGERCIDADEIREYMQKKENSDNLNDYQSSPLNVIGGPSGTRTPDHPVMSREL